MIKKLRLSPTALYDRVVLGYPKVVILFLVLMVGLLAYQIRYFSLDASAETLILEDDKDLLYSREVSSRYGQKDFAILTFTPRGELFSQPTLETLGKLRDELAGIASISSVLTILDVPLMESSSISLASTAEPLPTLGSPTVDLAQAKQEFLHSPLYSNMLVSPDSRTTALLISFADDEVQTELIERRDQLLQPSDSQQPSDIHRKELDEILAKLRKHKKNIVRQRHEDIVSIRSVMDQYRSEAELFLGGTRMIADDMITFIKSDLMVFGLGGAILSMVMLWIIFRRKRWVLLPMLCCAGSAVSMIGLLGMLRWQVTVISSNFISLQLIITLAIAVHIVVRYRELLAANPDMPTRQLICETVRLKFRPCVFAVLTTIVGFGSLVLSNILPVIMFGWMMIVGLCVSLVLTFLLLPVALMLLPKPPSASEGGPFDAITRALARITESKTIAILVIGGLVFGVSVAGITQLEVENSFIDYFRPSTEIYQGMKVIDEQLGGTTPLDVIIQFESLDSQSPEIIPAVAFFDEDDEDDEAADAGDFFDDFDEADELDGGVGNDSYWFTQNKLNRIRDAHRYLESLPETGKVISLATALDIAEKLNDGKPLDSFELALVFSKTPDQFRKILIDPYVCLAQSQIRLWVRIKDSRKDLRRNELLAKIKNELPGVIGFPPEKIRLSGLLVLYNNMLQSLFSSQIGTLGITVALLSGMFWILFKSWRIALLAMFPNVLPVAVVLGLMGWAGIPLDMMTITVAAIGVGIAVDNTIHYLHRFKEEFASDGNYPAAMHRCHGSIGHAMFYTSFVITAGLFMLALSNFIPTVYFGLLTGLVMIIALVADLMVLPAIIVFFKPFGRPVTGAKDI